jgi:hypothetical protein
MKAVGNKREFSISRSRVLRYKRKKVRKNLTTLKRREKGQEHSRRNSNYKESYVDKIF